MTTQAPGLTIIDAINDPNLFEPWFTGETWWAWSVALKAAFGLPMDDAECVFFRTIADRDPPKQPVKELWIIVGRRGGKDSAASLIATYLAAMFTDTERRLRPGERALVACLATDRDQAKIILNYIRSYFTDIDMLRSMVLNGEGTATGIELDNGVDISILTTNFRSVRGRAILAVVLDECAFWRDETSANPDLEVYRALRPGLASLPGSLLVGISSPYGKSGLLYKKHKDHYGKNNPDVLVIKAPTRALNPTISQSIVDEALADDPVAAAAEWLAEFRDDIAGWASREVIEAAVDRGVIVRPPLPNVRYVSFVDASGGVKDSFASAIAHAEGDTVILDCLLEIRAPFNPDTATEQVAAMLKSYRCLSTTGDKYAAQWVVQAFQKCGIRYEHSERDRSAIYLDALPLFTTGRARLLDDKRLIGQFASLERRTSSNGKDRVDHGPSGSDDCCNAASGAMVLAISKKRPMVISDEALALSRLATRGGGTSPWPRAFFGARHEI